MPHGQQRWGGYQIRENGLWLSDVTTGDVSITRHGFAPKAPNDATKYLDGTGAYSVPAGGSGIGAVLFDSTLGADTATIDTGAAGIAGGYNTLEIVIYGRTDEATTLSAVALTFNNDTGANYGRQYVGGANAAAVAGTSLTDAGILIVAPGTSYAASIFASWHFTVPAYTQTTAYKACGGTGGAVDTTAANCAFYALGGVWRSTSAITRAAITPTTAGKKLLAGSRLTIYGF